METVGGFKLKSKLEVKVAKQLEEAGVDWKYEPFKLKWDDKLVGAKCFKCGNKNITKQRSYTVDFVLGSGIAIEVKGRLTRRDRKIISGVKQANPSLDYRLIFDKDNKIEKNSETRYSEWAVQNGFQYSMKGEVPKEWLK